MKTKDKVVKFLKQHNIEYTIYTEPQFLADEAIKLGAIEAIAIRHNVDLYFNNRGKLLGTATDSIGSWRKTK